MKYYPLFVDLTASDCLIVGVGTVGRRKLSSLLEANAKRVLALDIAEPTQETADLLNQPGVFFERREFQPNDVEGKTIVFAATSNPAINRDIARCCASKKVLCNAITAPHEGAFIVPAHINQGGVSIAISTDGASPALSRKLREDLSAWLDDTYMRIVTFLKRLRPLTLSSSDTAEHNARLFRKLVDSELTDALNRQDRARCEDILQELLPKRLQPHIAELLHELV